MAIQHINVADNNFNDETLKTSIASDDLLLINDSADSNKIKSIKQSSIVANVKADSDISSAISLKHNADRIIDPVDGNTSVLTSNDFIQFNISGSEKLRVTSDGLVGIGITNPTGHKVTIKADTAPSVALGIYSDSVGRGLRLYTPDFNGTDTGSGLLFGMGAGSGNTYSILQGVTAGSSLTNGDIVFNPNGGKVGIGTDSPVYEIDVNGSVRGKACIAGGDTFVFDGLLVARNSSNQSTVYIRANGNTFFNGGNVGIGIASPSVLLHLQKDQADITGLYITNNSNNSLAETNLSLISYNGFGDIYLIGKHADSAWGETDVGAGVISSSYNPIKIAAGYHSNIGDKTHFISFHTGYNADPDLVERMRIDKDGKVGIGTPSPNELLHLVSSTTQKPVIKLENTNSDEQSEELEFYKNSSTPADNDELGQINFYGKDDAANKTVFGYIRVFSKDVTDTDEAGGLRLYCRVDDLERNILDINGFNGGVGAASLVINEEGIDCDFRVESGTNPNALFVQGSDGCIGIGTASPAMLLHLKVSGTSAIQRFERSVGGGDIYDFDLGNSAFGLYNYTDSKWVWRESAGNLFLLEDAVGKVGIGTNSPDDVLHLVRGTTGNPVIKFTRNSGNSWFGVCDANYIITGMSAGDMGLYSAQNFWLQTANSYNLILQPAYGSVGIGTSSPSLYADLTLEGGKLCLKETTTPTANTDYGKIYTKSDNKLYFQDGTGTEHEIAFV